MALSKAVTKSRGKDGRAKLRKIMFIDSKKAHLNPRCDQQVYIDLPEEAEQSEGMCGRLVFWLYGCRPAAQAWENFYAEKLEGVGFKRGDACGVVFYEPERDITVVCHGDDFICVGEEEDLTWLAEEIGNGLRSKSGRCSDPKREMTERW